MAPASNVCFQELSIHLRGHQRNLTQQEILKEWVKVEVNSFFPRNGKFVWLSGNKMKPGKFVVCQGSNAVFKHSLKAEIVSPRVLLTIHNVHSEPKYYLSKGNLTCLLTVSKCLSVTYWSFRLEFSILERFMCLYFFIFGINLLSVLSQIPFCFWLCYSLYIVVQRKWVA